MFKEIKVNLYVMKFYFAFLFACVTSLTFSQKIDVNVGPVLDGKQIRREVELPRFAFDRFSLTSAMFFNPDQSKAYMGFGYKDKAFQFAVFDNYVNYAGAKELVSENISERVTLNAFVVVKGKMFVLYSIAFPDQDSFSIYVNEVSEDMVVLGSPIVLHSFKAWKSYGMNVYVQRSRNNENFLISRILQTKPKEKQKIECKAVDQSFAEIWYKSFEMENRDKDVEIRSVAIDNGGNWYCLVESLPRTTTQPVLYAYFHKSNTFKMFAVGPQKGKSFGTRFGLLNGERPYVIGLNDENKKMTYFIFRVDIPTATLVNLGSNLMPPDFYKSSSFRGFSNDSWNITHIVSLENNTIAASVEGVVISPQSGRFNCYNTYVMGFREDGSQAWTSVVYKKQMTERGLAGHVLIPVKDHVLVIYNDHEKNLSKNPRDSDVTLFATANGMGVVHDIDPSGKVSKYPLVRDPKLRDSMMVMNFTARIKDGLYYANILQLRNRFSGEFRSMTIAVK